MPNQMGNKYNGFKEKFTMYIRNSNYKDYGDWIFHDNWWPQLTTFILMLWLNSTNREKVHRNASWVSINYLTSSYHILFEKNIFTKWKMAFKLRKYQEVKLTTSARYQVNREKWWNNLFKIGTVLLNDWDWLVYQRSFRK